MLDDDARISFRRVAAEPGVTDGTVRARIRRPQRSGLLIFAPLVTGKIDRAASALMFVTMRCAAREMKADRDALLPLDVVRALYDTKAAHRMVAVCEGRGSPAAYSAASISP